MIEPVKMTTFSHGLIFYCLVVALLCSAVSAFAAVPDISKFEKMKHQIEKLDENLYSPEKEVPKHGLTIPDQIPRTYHRTQYGKAAQSNDRLAFQRSVRRLAFLRSVRRAGPTADEKGQRYRQQMAERNKALVRKWLAF
eukprot:TRINITY_DN39677_c0_g1_i1.p1 TRINITY_DN39677_c0_g1~~TRINITY_DN39677_c0_g1_i1.p1  ORF type:complete len:139 (-),score=37.83 TRINITY_DN39677_c0_g1_i1:115-531(-)